MKYNQSPTICFFASLLYSFLEDSISSSPSPWYSISLAFIFLVLSLFITFALSLLFSFMCFLSCGRGGELWFYSYVYSDLGFAFFVPFYCFLFSFFFFPSVSFACIYFVWLLWSYSQVGRGSFLQTIMFREFFFPLTKANFNLALEIKHQNPQG